MLLTAVVFGLLPAGNIHADSEENIHYLGFASDLHDTPDVLEDALNQLPEEPEYFSLIGDMAGGRGNMRPEYSSSEVIGRVTSVLPIMIRMQWMMPVFLNVWESRRAIFPKKSMKERTMMVQLLIIFTASVSII